MEIKKDKKTNKNKADQELKENQNSSENEEKNQKKDLSIEDKLKDTEDRLLRTLAELENQRRRFEKETKEAFEFGGFNFAKETLSLLDNLQRAQTSIKNDENLKNSKDLEKFLKNIEIIEKDLVSIFEKNNIKKIESIGKKFDPNLHQAMTEIEDEKHEAGSVVQEIQSGYMLGKRLLRPVLVSVAKNKNTKTEEKEEKKG